jgi:hypothetical protein
MKNIIKTDNYLLVVSDEEIKVKDKVYWTDPEDGISSQINTALEIYEDLIFMSEPNASEIEAFPHEVKKIIAHLPLNNSPILEGVDLLPPLEDEPKGFDEYEYTEDDMIEYSNWLFKWCEYNKYRKLIYGVEPYGIGEFISDKDMFVKFLKEKSHQQPKYPIGFECEMVTRVFDVYPQTINHIPKTTTNSQGQTQLVGTYIYEN